VLKKVLHPSAEPYWKEVYLGASQDIFFSTTSTGPLHSSPGCIPWQKKLDIPRQDIGVYIQPTNMGTSCHCESAFPTTQGGPKEEGTSEEALRHRQ